MQIYKNEEEKEEFLKLWDDVFPSRKCNNEKSLSVSFRIINNVNSNMREKHLRVIIDFILEQGGPKDDINLSIQFLKSAKLSFNKRMSWGDDTDVQTGDCFQFSKEYQSGITE